MINDTIFTDEFAEHLAKMSVQNKLLRYYKDLIYYTDPEDWPKELKLLAVKLTGRFDVVTKKLDKETK